jgi:hypothetical protein
MLAVVPIVLCILAVWGYIMVRVFVNEENLELRSVVIKAVISRKGNERYGNGYSLIYSWRGRIYKNYIQTSAYDFNVGDSVDVKIDSKNPEAYCEVAY